MSVCCAQLSSVLSFQETSTLIRDAIAASESVVNELEYSRGINKSTGDAGYDVRVAAALGDMCQGKIAVNAERFCSEAVRKCVSRMISFRVQRLYLVKRGRELVAERNAIAEDMQANDHEDGRRRLAGITLALRSIQAATEALSEKEHKDGLSG